MGLLAKLCRVRCLVGSVTDSTFLTFKADKVSKRVFWEAAENHKMTPRSGSLVLK